MRDLITKKTAVVIAISCAAFIAVLYAMGRIPYCECGLRFGTWSAWSNETSQDLVDPYTTSHVLHGIIFFGALWFLRKKLSLAWRFVIALYIEIGWEILENSPLIINRYREATAALGYSGDSILNSFGDLLSAAIGFWIAMKLPWKWTLALSIVIELVMLWTIKDNLTLNVIMLVWPIQAIKDWQLAI